MCTISYGKCACLLVIFAVLSCSGYRIDNLAMTDISRREEHRVRHRLSRAQPTAAPRRLRCPEPDALFKTYRAGVVVLARVESKKCLREECTVFFKVLETLKNSSYAVDDRIRLRFPPRGRDAPCDQVKPPKIEPNKEYVLFLDADGAHSFNALFAPQVRRNRTLHAVRKVVGPNFKLKPLKLEHSNPVKNSKNNRLKLVCKAKGFPIPIIYWKRNNTLLHPNQRYRIKHNSDGKERRKSTLFIKNYTDAESGSYKCVAKGADDSEASYTFHTSTKPSFSDKKPCPMENSNQIYCEGRGKCFFIESMKEFMCECDGDYHGPRCQYAQSNQSSEHDESKS